MYRIYLITNKKNNKKYIGITKFLIEERFIQHTRRGFILTDAIKKYGKDNFYIELIEEVDDEEKAYELEKLYIKIHNTKIPFGYNISDGGRGVLGVNFTEEGKIKISNNIKKMHQEKRTGMHGKKHSPETIEKMKKIHKGKKYCLGTKRSKEICKKISERQKGRILSEETRKKISKNHHDVTGENNPMYGKNHSPETIEKLKNAAKNRPKRIWVNNMVEEKLIPFDSEIPLNYIKGRLPFK